jgi:hypothetical protein
VGEFDHPVVGYRDSHCRAELLGAVDGGVHIVRLGRRRSPSSRHPCARCPTAHRGSRRSWRSGLASTARRISSRTGRRRTPWTPRGRAFRSRSSSCRWPCRSPWLNLDSVSWS